MTKKEKKTRRMKYSRAAKSVVPVTRGAETFFASSEGRGLSRLDGVLVITGDEVEDKAVTTINE